MSTTASELALTMSKVIDAKYPNNWVVLVMNMVTGRVDPIMFEKTDEGKREARDVLFVACLALPLDVLVFTNISDAIA